MPAGASFVSISAGDDHTCAITSAGTAYCWGYSDLGRLGSGSVLDEYSPVPVAAPSGASFVSISAGATHTCAVTTIGAAYCWGSNGWGKLGNGGGGIQFTPALVSQAQSAKFVSISAATSHTCAVTAAGEAYCWGSGSWGELGNGGIADQATPVAVTQPAGATFTAISAYGNHTCAVTATGAAYCWGSGADGQLGNGDTSQQNTPVAVSDVIIFAWVTPNEPADLTTGRTASGGYALAARPLHPHRSACPADGLAGVARV